MPFSRPRPALTILVKLLLAYVLPTLALFSLFAYFAYDNARRDLEAELGTRLASIAASTATQIRGKYLLSLAPGDESDRAYLNTKRKLEAIKTATELERLFVFRADHTSLCDTEAIPIGSAYPELALDKHELSRVFSARKATSSLLFGGKDGVLYKAGYSPIVASEEDLTVVGAVRVEAPAVYFARLVALKRHLLRYGALLCGVVILSSLVVATLLTRPIRRLAYLATDMGRGNLQVAIDVRGGDEIGLLAHTLDNMRQALRARDERLQMMLAGIAHEVRNPLGGIELYVGILKEELALDPERLAHLGRIERELGYLRRVVSDFLEYARRPTLDLVPTVLGPLLHEIAELCRSDAESAGVELEVQAEDGVVCVADPGQLRRALLNLVQNAVQATPHGARVTLSAAREDDRALVRVTDQGKGIPEDALDKIFTPFFTTKEKGTGLGLAFVKEIISDHGGRIDVHTGEGPGTVFTVELPARDGTTSPHKTVLQ
jgi:signal transduction histidine kinase